MTTLKRFFLRSHRPLDIDVFDGQQQAVLHLTRSFFFFFSDLEVLEPASGTKFGSIHRRFGIIYKKYDLYDNNPDFEVLGLLTSKMNLFDGFKRHYSAESKFEEISGLNAKQLSVSMSNIRKHYRELKGSSKEYDLFCSMY